MAARLSENSSVNRSRLIIGSGSPFRSDVVVDIQLSDVFVSLGDTTEISCNFTGQYRVRRNKVTWLKGNRSSTHDPLALHTCCCLDGKPLLSDASRITVSKELPNATVTTLHIVASRASDSGSYRCSDGHSVQSKEVKLYLRDGHARKSSQLLSSSSFTHQVSLRRTVFVSYMLVFVYAWKSL